MGASPITGRLGSVVLGTPDPPRLADFWQALTGFTRWADEPDWVRIGPADGSRPGLSFQLERDFVPPVWPTVPGAQQMTMHLDILVEDLPAAVARAVELGARQAGHQPPSSPGEDVVVMLDPDGHVFCLFELR